MNWETVALAAIAAVPPTLVAAAAYIQASRATAQSKETHDAACTRMDKLLEIAAKAAAKGSQ